ncbi:MAG: XRE family transcriptional regulator, partial [Microvirgula sp.]
MGDRIRVVRDQVAHMSRDDFAQQLQMTRSSLQLYEDGKREPKPSLLRAMAAQFNIDPGWLLTGEGAMLRGASVPEVEPCLCLDTLGSPVDLDEFVFVPRYNLQASAGHGAASDGEKPVFTMAFRRYWIVNYLRADPHDLSVISVKGDSMEGVLNDRDVILINRSDTQATGGLFVLRIDGDLVVKRVQRLPGALLKVTSANEAYEPFTVDINNPPSDFS